MTKAQARLEYFNEVVLMMVMYTIITYSPWVDDPIVTFYIGYVTILFVILHLIVNFTLIFRNSLKSCKLKCRSRYLKKELKKQRKKI